MLQRDDLCFYIPSSFGGFKEFSVGFNSALLVFVSKACSVYVQNACTEFFREVVENVPCTYISDTMSVFNMTFDQLDTEIYSAIVLPDK